MFGLFFIILTLIVCATILFAMYMDYCSINRVGMFKNPKYEERIDKLERKVKALEAR